MEVLEKVVDRAASMRPRFYTIVPRCFSWPWHFYVFHRLNMKTYNPLYRSHELKHCIVDTGVGYLFHHKKLRDYPPGFYKKYVTIARKYTDVLGDRIWFAIPDFPDDYYPGEMGDNVERTLRNIERFVTIDGVNWLVIIQSRYMNTFSFIESCERVRELVGDYPRIAIGTVCKSRNLRWIEFCLAYARKVFPHSWIHAFGLTLSALPRCYKYIDSWDSTAWTFPRKPHMPSYKTKKEEIRYFLEYLKRIEEILPKS